MIQLFITNDPYSRAKIIAHLDYLDELHKGKRITYSHETKRNRAIRSLDQNRYYWGMLTMIAAKTGYTKEQLHQAYALQYIPHDELINGQRVARSTSELNTEEMSIYIKKIKAHAIELDLYIPEASDEAYTAWERMAKNHYDAMFSSLDE